MKGKKFLTGILGVMLVFGLVLFVGCPTDDGDSGPKKYTVTFAVNEGTLASGQLTQEVEEGKYANAPVITAPAGKVTDGWTTSVPSIATPASPITTDVTFTAKWKDAAAAPAPAANPLVGAWRSEAGEELGGLYIFTGGNPSVAYYTIGQNRMVKEGTNLDELNTSIPINGESYTYRMTGENLVIVMDPADETQNLTLTRAAGTAGNGVYGVWYMSQGTPANNMLLIIRQDKKVYLSVGRTTNWQRQAYTLIGNAPNLLIQIEDVALPIAYRFDPDDATSVTIGGTLYKKVTLP
jgi:hypothetical protein